jgi:hypothetical protein
MKILGKIYLFGNNVLYMGNIILKITEREYSPTINGISVKWVLYIGQNPVYGNILMNDKKNFQKKFIFISI